MVTRETAEALGLGRSVIYYYEGGRPIPRVVELLCQAGYVAEFIKAEVRGAARTSWRRYSFLGAENNFDTARARLD
jgi:hypothetical protein